MVHPAPVDNILATAGHILIIRIEIDSLETLDRKSEIFNQWITKPEEMITGREQRKAFRIWGDLRTFGSGGQLEVR